MSESIAGMPPPRSTTSLEIVAESLSMLHRSFSVRWDVWLVAAIFFTGTNIVDVVFASPGGPFHSPLTIASLIVRIGAAVLVIAAALRTFTGHGRVWAADLRLLLCTAAVAGLFIVSMLLLFIVSHFITWPLIAATTHDPHTIKMASLVVIAVWLVIFDIVTVRLSPWIAALVIGDNSIDFWTAWKGMRGVTLAAIGALIWIAPVTIAHFVLTAQAQHLRGAPQIALTVIDGLVSVLQVMLAMALAAVLYRFVAKNKPSP